MDRIGQSEPGAQYNALARAEGWAGLCDATLAFRRPELAAMLALWRGQIKDGAAAPYRHAMTPKLLKQHLPNIAIYERVQPAQGTHRYRVRIMGTKFSSVMGDLTGKFIDEAVPPQFHSRWYSALDAVLDAGVPLRFLSRSDTTGKPFLYGEFLEAPLLAPDGSMSMIFAASIYTPAASWREIAGDEPLFTPQPVEPVSFS
jgi:hypothetical protein